jgi:hypothetical protein
MFQQKLPQESTPMLMLPLVLQNLFLLTPFTASDCFNGEVSKYLHHIRDFYKK